MTSYLTEKRIPPSGPVFGSPPVLIGGPSQENGRAWRQMGSGPTINMPGSENTNPVVPGMSSIVVDLKAGYFYDLDIDIGADGAEQGEEDPPGRQQYIVLVYVSPDGGTTWTMLPGATIWCEDFRATGRMHRLVTSAADYNLARVFCQSVAPTSDQLLLRPAQSVLRIQEYSPVL